LCVGTNVTTMMMSRLARVKVMMREPNFVCCRVESLRDSDFPDLLGKKVEAPRISTLSKVEAQAASQWGRFSHMNQPMSEGS
jgi:hypothetical protein